MPAVSNVVELPVRHEGRPGERRSDDRNALAQDIVLALATEDDLDATVARAAAVIRRDAGAHRIEWWGRDENGMVELIAADGIARGRCRRVPLGRAGVIVLHGGWLDPRLGSALVSAAAIVRRRTGEDRLALAAIRLARRNQALEDFAALVAHELKTPLQAALVSGEPLKPVKEALHLVEELLEAAQNEPVGTTFSSAAESLDAAARDLPADVVITSDLADGLPLPPGPLRVILRNLLSNAAAAGARHIHIATVRSSRSWDLVVDDDGFGLGEADRYETGSGLGLMLCRRIATRFGGVMKLAPRPTGGTRATLEFVEASQ
jgi:signal transduction histidine kinase